MKDEKSNTGNSNTGNQTTPNEHINYKILAKHFGLTNEAMRINYKKFTEGKPCLWLVYVKAYNFDYGIRNIKGLKDENTTNR